MPSYYNPYATYPGNSYQTMGGASFSPYQYGSIPMQVQQPQMIKPIEWVEGEVGAKAYQMPNGLPANQPVPLWDSTDTVIYLKSWNQMGMPNPLQVIRYKMDEQPIQNLPGQSSATGSQAQSQAVTSMNYVTKEEYDELKNSIYEIKEMLNRNNQNGGNSVKNHRYKEDTNV